MIATDKNLQTIYESLFKIVLSDSAEKTKREIQILINKVPIEEGDNFFKKIDQVLKSQNMPFKEIPILQKIITKIEVCYRSKSLKIKLDVDDLIKEWKVLKQQNKYRERQLVRMIRILEFFLLKNYLNSGITLFRDTVGLKSITYEERTTPSPKKLELSFEKFRQLATSSFTSTPSRVKASTKLDTGTTRYNSAREVYKESDEDDLDVERVPQFLSQFDSPQDAKSKYETCLRIRGKLLLAISNGIHGENGKTKVLRSSFRRWYLRSHPRLIKNCLEEIVVKSRLTDYSALLRFKRLVRVPIERNILVKKFLILTVNKVESCLGRMEAREKQKGFMKILSFADQMKKKKIFQLSVDFLENLNIAMNQNFYDMTQNSKSEKKRFLKKFIGKLISKRNYVFYRLCRVRNVYKAKMRDLEKRKMMLLMIGNWRKVQYDYFSRWRFGILKESLGEERTGYVNYFSIKRMIEFLIRSSKSKQTEAYLKLKNNSDEKNRYLKKCENLKKVIEGVKRKNFERESRCFIQFAKLKMDCQDKVKFGLKKIIFLTQLVQRENKISFFERVKLKISKVKLKKKLKENLVKKLIRRQVEKERCHLDRMRNLRTDLKKKEKLKNITLKFFSGMTSRNAESDTRRALLRLRNFRIFQEKKGKKFSLFLEKFLEEKKIRSMSSTLITLLLKSQKSNIINMKIKNLFKKFIFQQKGKIRHSLSILKERKNHVNDLENKRQNSLKKIQKTHDNIKEKSLLLFLSKLKRHSEAEKLKKRKKENIFRNLIKAQNSKSQICFQKLKISKEKSDRVNTIFLAKSEKLGGMVKALNRYKPQLNLQKAFLKIKEYFLKKKSKSEISVLNTSTAGNNLTSVFREYSLRPSFNVLKFFLRKSQENEKMKRNSSFMLFILLKIKFENTKLFALSQLKNHSKLKKLENEKTQQIEGIQEKNENQLEKLKNELEVKIEDINKEKEKIKSELDKAENEIIDKEKNFDEKRQNLENDLFKLESELQNLIEESNEKEKELKEKLEEKEIESHNEMVRHSKLSDELFKQVEKLENIIFSLKQEIDRIEGIIRDKEEIIDELTTNKEEEKKKFEEEKEKDEKRIKELNVQKFQIILKKNWKFNRVLAYQKMKNVRFEEEKKENSRFNGLSLFDRILKGLIRKKITLGMLGIIKETGKVKELENSDRLFFNFLKIFFKRKILLNKRQSFEYLRNTATIAENLDESKKGKRSDLVKILGRRQLLKLRNSFIHLRYMNSDYSHIKGDKKELFKKVLTKKIYKNIYPLKVAFDKLRALRNKEITYLTNFTNCVQSNWERNYLREIQKRCRRIKDLNSCFNKLKNSQNEKIRIVLQTLKDINDQKNIQDDLKHSARFDSYLSFFVSKLRVYRKKNLYYYFHTLKTLKDQKLKHARFIFNKLQDVCFNNQINALKIFVINKNFCVMRDDKFISVLDKIQYRVNYESKYQGFGELEKFRLLKNAEEKILKKMMLRMDGKKLYCLNHLKNLADFEKEEEKKIQKLKDDFITKFVEKTQKENLLRGLRQLQNFSEEFNDVLNKVERKFKIFQNRKKVQCYALMKSFYTTYTLKQVKCLKLNNNIKPKILKNLFFAFKKIQKKSQANFSKRIVSLQTLINNKNRLETQSCFQNLSTLLFLKKQQIKLQKLSDKEKNQALAVAQKRANGIFRLLNIVKDIHYYRMKHSFDDIYNLYMERKIRYITRSKLKGALRLHILHKKIVKKVKKDSIDRWNLIVRHLKLQEGNGRVKRVNPWFERIMDKLKYNSKINDQVSLWRLKKPKPLKKISLKSEDAIKLTRLISIMRKYHEINLSKAFWKVERESIRQRTRKMREKKPRENSPENKELIINNANLKIKKVFWTKISKIFIEIKYKTITQVEERTRLKVEINLCQQLFQSYRQKMVFSYLVLKHHSNKKALSTKENELELAKSTIEDLNIKLRDLMVGKKKKFISLGDGIQRLNKLKSLVKKKKVTVLMKAFTGLMMAGSSEVVKGSVEN